MEKIVYQLSSAELAEKHVEAYIFARVEEKVNPETGQHYVSTDNYSTGLARTHQMTLELDKLRPYFTIVHMGGGMVQSEIYQTDIAICDDSKAIFTTQSSGKIFQCEPGTPPTTYNVNIQVGDRAMLEFVNDSIILYDGARFQQTNNIYLTDTSTLVYTEILGPGWSSTGLDHQYDLMHMRTNVYCGKKLLLFDNLLFEPKKQDPNVMGVMDKYRRCGTGLFVCPEITPDDIENVRQLIREQFPNEKNYYELGISSLSIPSMVVRILADEVFEIQHILNAIHAYVREKILGLPMVNLRKI